MRSRQKSRKNLVFLRAFVSRANYNHVHISISSDFNLRCKYGTLLCAYLEVDTF